MDGWLSLRSGPLLLVSERFFFRLRWGFLSQYSSEQSNAVNRYCIHGASIETVEASCKFVLTIGPLGILSPQGTDFPHRSDPSTRQGVSFPRTKGTFPWRREGRPRGNLFLGRRGDLSSYFEKKDVNFASPTLEDSKPRKLVLVADNIEEFRLWALLISRGRSRSISRFFELETVVGNGSMGEVYRANILNPAYGQVAVKRIEYNTFKKKTNAAKNLRRIQKEIQTQVKAASRSPHVVKLIDVFFDSRYVYLVMEMVEGGSLREWLDKHRLMEEPVAISIAQQMTRCLLSLHQHRIVHRDIKSDNVMLKLDRNGNIAGVLLTDFGFAEVCRTGDMDKFCSTFMGTASYMATEIASFVSYGAPVDMYALGIMVCAMLSGLYPFDDHRGLMATLESIKEADPSRIETCDLLSADAKSFCLALINPRPEKRLSPIAALQHRWLRRGKNVATGVLASPHLDRSPRAWFRRAFQVISAYQALQAWVREPVAVESFVDPSLSKARQNMLRRLDREIQLKEQIVRRPSNDEDGQDDGEVFVGEESSRTLQRFRHPQLAETATERELLGKG